MATEEEIVNEPIPVPDITREEWEATHPKIRGFIQAILKRLEAIEEKLNTNSSNSSKPPSSDPPGSLPNRNIRTGKPRGGQKGHRGYHRALLPTEDASTVVEHYPQQCSGCGRGLSILDGMKSDIRHQVWELPPMQAEVTEHQLHRACCPACAHVSQAVLPSEVPQGAFGPRLTAMVGLLVGCYRLSRRQCESLLKSGFGVSVSLGGIKILENLVSGSIAAAHQEAQDSVQSAEAANIDDTGWKEAGRNAVLWNVNTPNVAFYKITESKDHLTAKSILGGFDGILGADRAKTYSFHPVEKSQTCHAHLDRHFQRMEDRGGDSKSTGTWGKAETDRFFGIWHNFKDGVIERTELQAQMVSHGPEWAASSREELNAVILKPRILAATSSKSFPVCGPAFTTRGLSRLTTPLSRHYAIQSSGEKPATEPRASLGVASWRG